MSQDEKTTFEKKIEAQLKEIDARMKLARAKADQLAAGAEESGRSMWDTLQKKRDDISDKLQLYKKATGSAASELQSGIERAAEEFSRSLDSAEQESE